jgi:hypothetical protein
MSNELPLSPPPSQPQRSAVKPKSAAIVMFAKYFIVIPYNGWIEEGYEPEEIPYDEFITMELDTDTGESRYIEE